MKWSLDGKARLHLAKVKVAGAQIAIARRRMELYQKLAPLIRHPDDKKAIRMVLRSKNMTPRYW